MNIATLYADCSVPDFAQIKQEGFDWRQAIQWLSSSAKAQGYATRVVTDERTTIDAWLRHGDARRDGLMRWVLQAQAETIRQSEGPCVMVSPDSLVMGALDSLFGDWDVVLLTRRKPKPIVNSVIGFVPSARLARLWDSVLQHAETLPPDSLEWGADIDALVSYLAIQPLENGVREVDGVRIRFLPMQSVFTSVRHEGFERPKTPVWDFKGARKRLMSHYARGL